MTGCWYEPMGKTHEKRMQDILRRRERWLSETPTAADCVIIVHPSDVDTIGWWMQQQGVRYAVVPHGGPSPSTVWFADGAEVVE